MRSEIAAAAARVGRTADEVQLLAVSKGVEVAQIVEAQHLGLLRFGENRVQELAEKKTVLPELNFELIGTLQTNKASRAAALAVRIQSLDRMSLAESLQRAADRMGRRIAVLIQVNLGLESQKHGVSPAECEHFLGQIRRLDGLLVEGLMGVAPMVAESEMARPYFRTLKRLCGACLGEEGVTCSMGMSHDFPVAVEEGATMVRVGSRLFGPRQGP